MGKVVQLNNDPEILRNRLLELYASEGAGITQKIRKAEGNSLLAVMHKLNEKITDMYANNEPALAELRASIGAITKKYGAVSSTLAVLDFVQDLIEATPKQNPTDDELDNVRQRVVATKTSHILLETIEEELT